MDRLKNETNSIDDIDAHILQALFKNARISIAELSRQIGLSSPSTAERLKRLEEQGVVMAYTIVVNPERLGMPLPLSLRIRPVPGELKKAYSQQALSASKTTIQGVNGEVIELLHRLCPNRT